MEEEKPLSLEQLADQVTFEREKIRREREEAVLAKKRREEEMIAHIRQIEEKDHELLTTDPLRTVFIDSARIIDRIFPGVVVFCSDYSGSTLMSDKYISLLIPYIYGLEQEQVENVVFGVIRSEDDKVKGLCADVIRYNYTHDIGKKHIYPVEEFVRDAGTLLGAWIDPYRYRSWACSEAFRSPIINQRPYSLQSTQQWQHWFSRCYPDDWNNRLYPELPIS